MKKPDFIEIRLPGRKSTFSSAKRKYFKGLENKILDVSFARNRERKIFKFLVRESDFRQGWSWSDSKRVGYWYLRLELKVPKEDLNKVL